MEATYRVLATFSAPIWDGSTKSLRELGYSDAGLDDCYQLCGSYGPDKCESGVTEVAAAIAAAPGMIV